MFVRILGVALVTLVMSTAPASAAPACTELLAGQTINVGSVCVDNDGEYLTVTYSTNGGWTLQEVHLAVAQDLLEIPHTKKGNPVPGQFEYSAGFVSGETSYTFEIPLGDLAAVDPCGGHTLYLASHAVVVDPNGDGTDTETAWGNGSRFVARGNWATYFTYETQCPGPQEPCVYATDTAIAWGPADFREDFGFGRWGWENFVDVGQTVENATLYAGQTIDVGDVTITYGSGFLTVTIQTHAGVTLDQVHIQAEDASISNFVRNNPDWGNVTVGGTDFKDLALVDQPEGTTYYVFSHAVDFDAESDGVYVTVHTTTTRLVSCPQ